MTDWERMTEEIRRAMQAVEATRQASEALQREVNAETLDAFRRQMQRLCRELQSMQWLLEHPGALPMDTIDALMREWQEGKRGGYRRVPAIDDE